MKKIQIKQPRQLRQEELTKIRRFFHRKQNNICPVLKLKVEVSDTVVDHAHKANSNNLGMPHEAGLVRGIIHRQANTMEGKITNSFIRCGLHKFDITLPNFLRELANYIENPPLLHLQLVHPSEKAKEKKLGKASFNKLEKVYVLKYPQKKKLVFPKSKKMTKLLEELFKEFNIEPTFLK
jgi:hypothetical protein